MARSSRGAGISRRTLLGGMAATPFALGARSALAQEASQPIATPKPTLSPGPNAVQLKYWDMQWGSAIFMSAMQDPLGR
ncbi:MAG TPA: hypothetical protein VM450_18150 [Thermomicrobiales bacterium]|nr:hypothetical protein [Thermomicrobiales bacterium]